MAKEKTPRKPKKTQSQTMVMSLLFGAGYAILAMIALLLLLPLFLKSNSNPDQLIPIFALFIALVSGVVSGIVSAKKHGQSGALTGLFSGMLLTVLLFIVSLFFKSGGVPSTVGYKALLVCLILFPSIISGKSALRKRTVRRRQK